MFCVVRCVLAVIVLHLWWKMEVLRVVKRFAAPEVTQALPVHWEPCSKGSYFLVFSGYIGIMEEKMETTRVWGYTGVI